MKTIWISDTHNNISIDIPDGDILFHTGDFTMSGTEKEIRYFNDWIGSLPHKHKVVIAGNHDWLFQTNPITARKLCTNFTYLEDSFIVIDGFKIYGTPWQPKFFDQAFNRPRGIPLKEKWDLIPKDINILMTHGPAFSHLDLIPNGMRVGCEDLEKVIRSLPDLLVHGSGHIHHSYGISYGNQPVRLNSSICDERYNPTRKPIEVEI